MEKLVELDINSIEDLYEKYNNNYVSNELINYLINEVPVLNKDDNLKIVINSKIKQKIDLEKTIKDGLQKEYTKIYEKHYQNDILQFIYLILGIAILFCSTFIMESVLKEVVIIGGWVFIWALLEMEIFTDKSNKKRRKIIQQLLTAQYEIK